MPRYYFHVVDSRAFPDLEGTELTGLAQARVEAVRVAGTMLRDHASDFWRSAEWRVVVTDAEHAVQFAVCCQALAAPVPPLTYDPRPEGWEAEIEPIPPALAPDNPG